MQSTLVFNWYLRAVGCKQLVLSIDTTSVALAERRVGSAALCRILQSFLHYLVLEPFSLHGTKLLSECQLFGVLVTDAQV